MVIPYWLNPEAKDPGRSGTGDVFSVRPANAERQVTGGVSYRLTDWPPLMEMR